MRVLYILLNIYFPYYNFVTPIYTKISGSISTFCFAVLISSPINSICGSTSRYCIVDIFSSSIGITSTFLCSWIPSKFFFLTPFYKVLW